MYIMFLFIDEGGGKLVMRISIIKSNFKRQSRKIRNNIVQASGVPNGVDLSPRGLARIVKKL